MLVTEKWVCWHMRGPPHCLSTERKWSVLRTPAWQQMVHQLIQLPLSQFCQSKLTQAEFGLHAIRCYNHVIFNYWVSAILQRQSTSVRLSSDSGARFFCFLEENVVVLQPTELFTEWRTLMRWLRGTVTCRNKWSHWLRWHRQFQYQHAIINATFGTRPF